MGTATSPAESTTVKASLKVDDSVKVIAEGRGSGSFNLQGRQLDPDMHAGANLADLRVGNIIQTIRRRYRHLSLLDGEAVGNDDGSSIENSQ